MDLYDFRDAVLDGLENYLDSHIGRTHLIQSFNHYSSNDSKGNPQVIAEKHFKSAILHGLNLWNISSDATEKLVDPWTKETLQDVSIKRIWCSKHDHEYLSNINQRNNEYGSTLVGERFAKTPDIAVTDNELSELPTIFCQVKFGVDKHVKAAQALGDLLWGYIDQRQLRIIYDRGIEYYFVWIEHKDDSGPSPLKIETNNTTQLKSGDPIYNMHFELSPGYHSEGLGNMMFDDYKKGNEWWDSKKGILIPDNKTAIKQILGTGTNASYYRMFNQPGTLHLNTHFFSHDIGDWHVHIHKLLPNHSLIGSEVGDKPHGKIFNWIP